MRGCQGCVIAVIWNQAGRDNVGTQLYMAFFF